MKVEIEDTKLARLRKVERAARKVSDARTKDLGAMSANVRNVAEALNELDAALSRDGEKEKQ